MKQRRLLIPVLWTFIFVFAVLLIEQQEGYSSEVRIVRFHLETIDGSKKAYLEPSSLWIEEGTIVVWVNQVPTEEVKIVFEDGTRCQDVTDAGNAFALDAACYVTSWVPFGGTSSLKFNESGDLDYFIESTSGIKVKGKIVVHSKGTWKRSD